MLKFFFSHIKSNMFIFLQLLQHQNQSPGNVAVAKGVLAHTHLLLMTSVIHSYLYMCWLTLKFSLCTSFKLVFLKVFVERGYQWLLVKRAQLGWCILTSHSCLNCDSVIRLSTLASDPFALCLLSRSYIFTFT